MISNDYLNTLTSKALMDKEIADLKTKQKQLENINFNDLLKDTNMVQNKTKQTNQTSNIDLKKLKEQTDAFEALMVKTVLDISLKQETSLFPKSVGSDIYNDMYNDAISKSIGGEIGFSDLLYDFLTERV